MWPFGSRSKPRRTITFKPMPDITIQELAEIVSKNGAFIEMSLQPDHDIDEKFPNLSRHFEIT